MMLTTKAKEDLLLENGKDVLTNMTNEIKAESEAWTETGINFKRGCQLRVILGVPDSNQRGPCMDGKIAITRNKIRDFSSSLALKTRNRMKTNRLSWLKELLKNQKSWKQIIKCSNKKK